MIGERTGEAAGLVAALVVGAPVLVGLTYSALAAVGLVGPGATGSASLHRISAVVADHRVWEGVAWSLWVAAASTAASALLAMVIAASFRTARPIDRAARAIALTPLPIPHIVAAVLALLVLGQSGVLGRAALAAGLVSVPADVPTLVYDPAGVGVIAALVWKETPFLALVAFSVLVRRAGLLEETARTLGARPAQVFTRVTAPVLWRGMLPAVVAVFVFAFGSYEVAALLAPSDPLALPLLTMERYTDASLAGRADAFVLVLIGLGVASLAVGAHEWLRRGWRGLDT